MEIMIDCIPCLLKQALEASKMATDDSNKQEEIVLEEPQIVKHGSKYGVKIKASAPSIHMIRANISTEIAPIVGEEYQAKDLMDYIEQGSNQPGESMWDVNIFGKTLEQLVGDGMQTKRAPRGRLPLILAHAAVPGPLDAATQHAGSQYLVKLASGA